jgi:hypothetical protein
MSAVELDDGTMAAVVASLGSGPRPVAIDRARIDRQIRDLALEHAEGRLEDAVYLERLHELRDAKENLERTSADGISPERAVAWLRELSATWRAPRCPRRRPRAPRHLRSDHRRRKEHRVRQAHSVGIRPRTRARTARKVAVARPTGFNRADAINIRIPIEGAGEWALTSTESA